MARNGGVSRKITILGATGRSKHRVGGPKKQTVGIKKFPEAQQKAHEDYQNLVHGRNGVRLYTIS